MAWDKNTVNDMLVATETIDGKSTAKAYTAEIDFFKMGPYGGVRWLRVAATPDTITGSNYDVTLEGAYESGGTKVVLKDEIIADMTVDGAEVATTVAWDLWSTPMPFLYLAFLSDTDETSNEIAITLTVASDHLR